MQGAIGLLQSLDQLGVLNHLDYLATVSGGGYIGGFWTAWLQRNKPTKTGERIFPIAGGRTTGESAEVRHLREFSRFLLPRFRVMGTESWSIVMTGLGGLLPSLTSALAVLVSLAFHSSGPLLSPRLTHQLARKSHVKVMVCFFLHVL